MHLELNKSCVNDLLPLSIELNSLRVLKALKTGSLVTLPGLLGRSCHLSADYFGVSPVWVILRIVLFFSRKPFHGLGNLTPNSIKPSLVRNLS